jgi:cephalosporin-C deacetylase-like acetyl esterase
MLKRTALSFVVLAAQASASFASPPLDLWTTERMSRIRDRSTLNPRVVVHGGYFEVFYDSEIGDAQWGDGGPPYEVHTGQTIRIHGYLASPLLGGPYPAIVIGHGHRGSGSRDLALALAAFGYVALSIDGPGQGASTGPPDTEQGWISVEELVNEPSPETSYLYHYAYAGMRGLTLLDELSRLPFNPLRIDRDRLGVLGASMGGQFTYYINGVDDRVKGAVALAVAGDWDEIVRYPGSWLYHGLYYYTRDGLVSGLDDLNTISDLCSDPTNETFQSYFDPIRYAPTQHAPLLTVVGSHDQYFTVPAVNTTYARTASAGTDPRFQKRIMIAPNGKHDIGDSLTLLPVISNVDRWFRYCFQNGPTPPLTPQVQVVVGSDRLRFRVAATAGSAPIAAVHLLYATQIDTTPAAPCDFSALRLRRGRGDYRGSLPLGHSPACGPPVSAENLLYYAQVTDTAGYTISSPVQFRGGEMAFGTDFVPVIEHFPRDDFAVPPPPPVCPAPRNSRERSGQGTSR